MEITDYIKQFAEYFVMLINMIKDFFGKFSAGEEDTSEEENA